ncbi:MAG TPA: hypothetical protein VFI38_04870 [Candidatus Acidoferrum sp.]|nr:hypothetical protein [Candidatus Acidoferrum sp.]
MKTLLMILFLSFATTTFVQAQSVEQAVAPGCGKDDVKFDVKTDKSQHPFPKPDPGKALVFLLQDDTDFLSSPRPTTRFGLDGAWIGATHSSSYFYVSLDPGVHHLCAAWQSFVGLTTGQKTAAAQVNAAAGGIYFFVVRNHAMQEHVPAGMKLRPLDPDEAQLLMSKYAISTFSAKK